jgi:CarD family transcriptional regulator
VPYVTIEVEGGMTVKVPADSLDEVGIREPVTAERAEEVLAVLSETPREDPGHAVRRRRDTDKLGSGRLIDCAEVVRDLTAVVTRHDKGATHADRKMLDSAREQMASELAVVLETTPDEAMARIDEALTKGAASGA